MVTIGKYYKFEYQGRTKFGKVEKIARLKNGCVLAFCSNGVSFPVSKYGKLTEIPEIETTQKRLEMEQ